VWANSERLMLGLTHGGDSVAPSRQRLELRQAQHCRLRRRCHLVQQHRVHRRSRAYARSLLSST
jgi:hypothetical protein